MAKEIIKTPGLSKGDKKYVFIPPVASDTEVGGIKVGKNLSIDEDGTLNAQAEGSSLEVEQNTDNFTKMISIPTGSGSAASIPIITINEFKNIEDKSNLGIIALVNTLDDFNISKFVIGKNYVNLTIEGNKVVECTLDNFVNGNDNWGGITVVGNPIILDDCIYLYGMDGNYLKYDLGNSNTPITLYAVLKSNNGDSSNRRIIAYNSSDTGKTPMVVNNNNKIQISTWANDTNTVYDTTNYCVIAFSIGNGNVRFYYNANNIGAKSISSWGSEIIISKTNHNDNETANVYLKYLTIVNEEQTEETILSNINNIMIKYDIS